MMKNIDLKTQKPRKREIDFITRKINNNIQKRQKSIE